MQMEEASVGTQTISETDDDRARKLYGDVEREGSSGHSLGDPWCAATEGGLSIHDAWDYAW